MIFSRVNARFDATHHCKDAKHPWLKLPNLGLCADPVSQSAHSALERMLHIFLTPRCVASTRALNGPNPFGG